MKKVEKEMLEECAVQNVEERSISAVQVPSAQSAQSSNAQNSQEQPVHVPGVEVKNLHVSFGQNHVNRKNKSSLR